MTYDSQKYHRRSIRLKGYDYSQSGVYFITVCVQDRACLFGEVVGDQMHLNDAGRIVLAEWNALPSRFPTVELDIFGVMPNHIHGIIVMETAGVVARSGATTRVWLPLPRLPRFVGKCKSAAVARLWATLQHPPPPGGVGTYSAYSMTPILQLAYDDEGIRQTAVDDR
jgi:hypothetical protein